MLNSIININDKLSKELLAEFMDDTIKPTLVERKPNTLRLYDDGRLNIALGGDITEGMQMIAKIIENVLVLLPTDKSDSEVKLEQDPLGRDTNLKFSIGQPLPQFDVYKQAILDSKVKGSRTHRSYDIVVNNDGDKTFYLVDLTQYADKDADKDAK